MIRITNYLLRFLLNSAFTKKMTFQAYSSSSGQGQSGQHIGQSQIAISNHLVNDHYKQVFKLTKG